MKQELSLAGIKYDHGGSSVLTGAARECGDGVGWKASDDR